MYPSTGLKPIEAVRSTNFERVERSNDRVVFFAYYPNALLYLRASDSNQADRTSISNGERGVRPALLHIISEERVIFNTHELNPLRHAFSWLETVCIGRTVQLYNSSKQCETTK